MSKPARIALISLGVFVLLIVIAISIIPLFLNGTAIRNRIQADLSKSLGRPVVIGSTHVSIWSGGLVADNVSVADDPRFSTQPFLQADSVKVRVKLIPLIFSRKVEILGFTVNDPKVDLLRAADGTWNYSTLGGGNKTAGTQSSGNSALTAGHIAINNGQITVAQLVGGSAAASTHTYNNVNLDVKNFGSTAAFPFTLSASLPGEGTLNAKGTAGPINQQDTANTPFTLHLDGKHLDPLAAGLVDPSSGISGLIDSLTLDANYSGRQMHISKILVGSPHLTLAQSTAPKPKATPKQQQSSFLQNLSIDDAEISNGSLTLTTPGKSGPPAVYQQIDAKLTNLTPTTPSPFTLSAKLPGGGGVQANGKAGPYNAQDTSATPVDAHVKLDHIQLGSAGILPADAGIAGLLNLQAQVNSNGQTLQANGTGQIDGIKLARDATPSPKPLDVNFAVTKNEDSNTGQIQHATLSVGGVQLQVSGTFQSASPSTALNLKVNGQNMPIDAIEDFLPAVGVHLPQGSQLRGGTLSTDLTVSGTTASPAVSGPVHVENTELAGFDLGSKLGELSRLTGGRIGAATGPGTNIKSLSMDVHEQNSNVRTDKVDLAVAGVGTATGNGTVSANGALDYSMLLKLTGLTGAPAAAQNTSANNGGVAGLVGGLLGASGAGKNVSALGGLTSGVLSRGIPVQIGGTTAHPTFAPNLKGLTTSIGASEAQQLINQKTGRGVPGKTSPGDQAPVNQVKKALGGLLGH